MRFCATPDMPKIEGVMSDCIGRRGFHELRYDQVFSSPVIFGREERYSGTPMNYITLRPHGDAVLQLPIMSPTRIP